MNIYSGKNLEEALDHAADGENVDIEYLQYRVVTNTEEKCEIEAYFVADVIDYVKSYLTTVLTNMGLTVELNAKYEKEVINMAIKTDRDAVLIGKGGKTLQAMNELVRVAINQRFSKHYKILLDVSDYKEEKYEKLIQMARKYAKEVQTTKNTITLNPMPSDERRIIHGVLASYHNIKTESHGQGKERRLSIHYVEE